MNTDLTKAILKTLPNGKVEQVCIGLHWTAVVINVDGKRRCGLASTLGGNHIHGEPDVPQAGQLDKFSGQELARLIFSSQPLLSGIGTAAINALLPSPSHTRENSNAEEIIARHGAGKSVALVGHFSFVSRLSTRVGNLSVLELNPRPGDLPAEMAAEIIPNAQVVAISGSTIINHTLSDLLALCHPDSLVIILGPSTVLSPILFNHGVDYLCGAVVLNIDPVLKTIQQGGDFRQVHRAGVKLVTLRRE